MDKHFSQRTTYDNVMKMWQIEHSHQQEHVEDYIAQTSHFNNNTSRLVMVWVCGCIYVYYNIICYELSDSACVTAISGG